MMDVNDKKIYEAAKKLTAKYSGALQKHLPLVFGCMLYIAFAAMAIVFYSPSYFACIGIGGTMWSLMNSVINALFIIMFMFFLMQDLFPANFLADLRVALPNILFMCIVYLIVSYGILWYRCRNASDCRTGTCPFNDRIMVEVNKASSIKNLYAFYKKEMGTERLSIATCTNYYNASYDDESGGTENAGCKPSSSSTLCNISLDPAVGAPVLAIVRRPKSSGGRAPAAGLRKQGSSPVLPASFRNPQILNAAMTRGAKTITGGAYPRHV